MLPSGVNGLSGGGGAAPAAVLTTLTQVASAAAGAESVTGPATIQAGDLLVLWDAANGGSTPAAVVPSGFNTLATANSGTSRAILSWKIATGAEASATLTGMNSTEEDKILLVFRGDIPITSVAPGGAAAVVQDSNPDAQVVPSSGGTPPLVVLAGYAAGGNIDPRTFSPAKDGEVANGTDAYLAWKIYNSAPADVTVDMDDEGTINTLASGYLACA